VGGELQGLLGLDLWTSEEEGRGRIGLGFWIGCVQLKSEIRIKGEL
jgi:hypothetical protein